MSSDDELNENEDGWRWDEENPPPPPDFREGDLEMDPIRKIEVPAFLRENSSSSSPTDPAPIPPKSTLKKGLNPRKKQANTVQKKRPPKVRFIEPVKIEASDSEEELLVQKKESKSKKRKNKAKRSTVSPDLEINIDELKQESKKKRKNLATTVYKMGKKEPWNMGVEIMLRKIAEKAGGYRWMHNLQKEQLDRKDSIYGWIERVLLGLTLVVSGIITLLTAIGVNDHIATILVTGALEISLLFLYTVIKETHDYQDFQAKIYANEQDARRYNEINLEIQKQFALDKSDRRPDKEFLTSMVDKYNDTIYQASMLDKGIMNKYLKATKRKDFSLPINLQDEEGQIKIVVTPDSQNGLEFNIDDTETKNKQNSASRFSTNKRYQYEMNRFLREF